MTEQQSRRPHGIVPPFLISRLAEHPSPRVAEVARRTLRADVAFRTQPRSGLRAVSVQGAAVEGVRAGIAMEPGAPPAPRRRISDAEGAEALPGRLVRAEGDPATGDPAADEAHDGLGETWELFFTAYGRDALDGAGGALLATVHYGRDYDNAFWDGTQMVFGDGDGEVFRRFTLSLDVIGHELTHGLTEATARLVYQGQSGALNESISDVFGSLVRQRVLGQSADQADWLIGADLFTEQVQGVALRSLKAPGTAYDDDLLGRDPQPATMADYVETSEDNGGVHINSGIPNHAFYLVALALGGPAWERTGQLWYDVLVGPDITPDCDFARFAGLTVAAARARFGEGVEVEAVRAAWQQVGVVAAPPAPAEGAEPGPVRADPGTAEPPSPGTGAPVRLIRSGGVAGMRRECTFVPDQLEPADAREWSALLQRPVWFHELPEPGAPDSFRYRLVAADPELDTSFGESQLPEGVRALVRRTLERGG